MQKTEIQMIEEENRRLFATRLREVVDKMGGPKVASDELKIPLSTLNTYLAGHADPKVSVAMRIAAAAQTSVAYLAGLTIIRDSRKLDFKRLEEHADALAEVVADARPVSDNDVLVPRLNVRVAAGIGKVNYRERNDVDKVPMARTILRRIGVQPQNAHFITVEGDSMEDEIKDRDDVLVDIGDDVPRPSGIYAVQYGEEALLKRVQPFELMNIVNLISDNPAYPPITIKGDERKRLRVIGRAKLVMRVL